MKRFRKILLPVICLLANGALTAQSSCESVYLQLHSQWLMAGDTLWAGVMVLDPCEDKLSTLSDIVYVELWADNASPVFRTRIKVKDGVGTVAIPLDPSTSSGYYLIRAYTRYMRNFPERHFFRHWVQVFQPNKPPALVEDGSVIYPLQVEVEPSGPLLTDQPCKVLVSIRDLTGAPASTDIQLLDQSGAPVQATVTDSVDLFVFEFTPKESSTYRFQVKVSPEEMKEIALPDPVDRGIRLQLMTSGPDPLVQIISGRENSQTNYDLVVKNGTREENRQALFIRPGATSTFPLAQLVSSRISDLILVDAESTNPVAAITVFLRELDTFDPWELEGRVDNDRLTISEVMPETQTLIATYSSSFSQGISLNDFLTGERGIGSYIPSHHPEEQIIWLDQWRPLSLSELVPVDKGDFSAEKGLLILEGKVEGANVEEDDLFVVIPGDPSWTRRVPCDAEGNFILALEQMVGQPEQIIYRSSDPNAQISLLPAFAPAPEIPWWPQLVMEEFQYDQLLADFRYQQTSQNFLQNQGEELGNPSPDLLAPVYGQPSHTYRFADYTRMPTEEAFIEFIPQVYLRKVDRRKQIFILNEQTNQLFEKSPLLMIDGIPVFSSEEILTTNYRLVDRVELVNEPFYLNGKVFDGVLNLITYQADGSSVSLNPGEVRAELLLSPVFQSARNQLLPGDRIPVISQPAGVQLLSPSEGSIQIQRKGIDRKGEHQLWIQGISAEGEILETIIPLQDDQR